ncbi:MAG: hypothetical protein JNL01_13810 [Bdellovibrionales bacterium]|nr:hypothetical protein [Bdellovibrionales bacterium]
MGKNARSLWLILALSCSAMAQTAPASPDQMEIFQAILPSGKVLEARITPVYPWHFTFSTYLLVETGENPSAFVAPHIKCKGDPSLGWTCSRVGSAYLGDPIQIEIMPSQRLQGYYDLHIQQFVIDPTSQKPVATTAQTVLDLLPSYSLPRIRTISSLSRPQGPDGPEYDLHFVDRGGFIALEGKEITPGQILSFSLLRRGECFGYDQVYVACTGGRSDPTTRDDLWVAHSFQQSYMRPGFTERRMVSAQLKLYSYETQSAWVVHDDGFTWK